MNDWPTPPDHGCQVIQTALLCVVAVMRAAQTQLRDVSPSPAIGAIWHQSDLGRWPAKRALYLIMPAETKPDHAALDASSLILSVARNQDQEAFKRLFEHFAPRVKTFMVRSGATVGQAEELAQETLLTVWRKAKLFDAGRAGPTAWIFTIARNLRIDGLRRAGREKNAISNMDEPGEDAEQPDEVYISMERDERVRSAIASLSEDQRRVVQLSFVEDKAHPEIARELDLPLGTVKSRIRLAMKRMREVLDGQP